MQQRAGLGGAWRAVRWPLAFALITGTIWLGYFYLPARDQRVARAETLIGAIAATGLWLLATWLFRLYVTSFGRYGRAYGAVIVLLIWFYSTAFAVLAGAALGAQLENERRDGAPGG